VTLTDQRVYDSAVAMAVRSGFSLAKSRLLVAGVLGVLLVACGKGDKPPPPSTGGLLAQESGPSHNPPHGNMGGMGGGMSGGMSGGMMGGGGGAGTSEADRIFLGQCVMCHGRDGTGNGPAAAGLPVKPRNYTDPKWQASVTDDEIKKTIVMGGAAVGKNANMPAFTQLKDQPEVLDGLVKIIRGFKR